MFVVFWFNRQLGLLAVSYSVMLLHEAAHMAAAYCIGLRPAFFALHPFGVCMRLKSRIVYSLADEILLYAAGPCLNILLALGVRVIFGLNSRTEFFYYCNLALFVTNILPVMPLDGGIIAKRLLMFWFGAVHTKRIMCVLSWLIIAVLTYAGVRAAAFTGYNYSVLVLVLMLMGNIFTQKEKFSVDFLKELMFYAQKDKNICGKGVHVLAAHTGEEYRRIAKYFCAGKHYMVCFTDDNGHICSVKSEREIMGELFNYSYNNFKNQAKL